MDTSLKIKRFMTKQEASELLGITKNSLSGYCTNKDPVFYNKDSDLIDIEHPEFSNYKARCVVYSEGSKKAHDSRKLNKQETPQEIYDRLHREMQSNTPKSAYEPPPIGSNRSERLAIAEIQIKEAKARNDIISVLVKEGVLVKKDVFGLACFSILETMNQSILNAGSNLNGDLRAAIKSGMSDHETETMIINHLVSIIKKAEHGLKVIMH